MITAQQILDLTAQGEGKTVDFKLREISNPGGLLPLVAKDFGHRSLTRNPLIFSLFTRMHLVEHIGSGIMRMQKDMLDAQLPAPKFSTEGFFTVTLRRQQTRTNVKHKLATITPTQERIIKVLRENPTCSVNDVIAATSFKKSTVYANLQKLKDAKVLSQDSDGVWHIMQ